MNAILPFCEWNYLVYHLSFWFSFICANHLA
jgi:hypothetical protein